VRAHPWQPLAGFKAGRYRVLVATDIAARGIDIADVSHVVNFDCPHIAEDYIHRVGRTGRAAATGDAFTFVSPEEQSNLRTIERAIGKRLPQITLPDFDYSHKPAQSLETAVAERIADIKRQKSQQRAGGGHGRAPQRGPNSQGQFAPRGNYDGNRPPHAPSAPRGDGFAQGGNQRGQHNQPNPRGGNKWGGPQQGGRHAGPGGGNRDPHGHYKGPASSRQR
jgi:ATP-dependent RNA helicase RhlE